jgi:hypothetical protein
MVRGPAAVTRLALRTPRPVVCYPTAALLERYRVAPGQRFILAGFILGYFRSTPRTQFPFASKVRTK